MWYLQEKILLHQVRRGNQAAFSRFYNEYVDKIQRFVLFKVSNKEKAEELTNTIFTQILNYLLEGKEIKNFRAFLYQTARNLIIDFYRTRRQEISLEEAKEVSFLPDYHQNIDREMEIEKIREHLSFLKPEHQEIILLRFFEGLSFREIAQIVNQTEENVRTIAYRGIKKLKEALKNQIINSKP